MIIGTRRLSKNVRDTQTFIRHAQTYLRYCTLDRNDSKITFRYIKTFAAQILFCLTAFSNRLIETYENYVWKFLFFNIFFDLFSWCVNLYVSFSLSNSTLQKSNSTFQTWNSTLKNSNWTFSKSNSTIANQFSSFFYDFIKKRNISYVFLIPIFR